MAMSGHELPITGRTVEWGTPKFILDALSPFDFDATNYTYFMKPWPAGFAWMNPPYGRDIGIWMQRIASHGSGIALIFARTDTEWWHAYVRHRASGALFLKGRLSFVPLNGQHTSSNAGAPSVLVAYGEEALRRLEKCGLKGWLVKEVPA